MNQSLRVLAINMASITTRLSIARAAAPIVVAAARAVTPMSSQPYHTFKRKNGKTSMVVAGNLILSTQDLSERRKRIANRGIVVVGPRYGRSGGGAIIGSTEANAYGNYAHMVYGSVRAYGQRVSARAAAASGAAATAAMQREALATFSKLKNKEGL